MGPFIKSKNSTARMMINVVIALIPIILFSFYKNGVVLFLNGYTSFLGMFYPLLFILVGAFSSFTFEIVYELLFVKSEEKLIDVIRGTYAFMPGLFLSLVLPINTPIYLVVLGAFFATIVGKMIFGGFGNNIFNPALIGALFILSAYSLVITNNGGYLNKMEIDTISSATPLSNYSVIEGIGTYDEVVKPYGGLQNLFLGFIPGSVGETSSLLCIIAFIFLTATETIKWRITASYVSVVFIISLIIGLFSGTVTWFPLFQLLTGGLLFGAVFMATDPVTSPVTKVGQVLYGIGLGIITVACRFLTNYPEGVLTSILTMNMFVFILDKIGVKSKLDFKKCITPFIVMLIFMVVVTLTSYNKLTKVDLTDPNYEILSTSKVGSKVTYIVTEKGYSSLIKLSITIDNGKVVEGKLLDQNDSFFQRVIDADFINTLVSSNNIKDVDTVSGATISSTAVKKAFINTVNDYNNEGYKKYMGKEVKEEKDFVINSKKEENDKTIYNVTVKSFGGTMNLDITYSKKITDIIIGDHTDNYIFKLTEADFINTVINNQDNLDIDTVSGATISSKAVLNAVKGVLIETGDINEG